MKKKVLIVFAIILVIIVVTSFLLSRRGEKEVETPPLDTTGESYKGVTPGESTKEDVIEKLGDPLSITNEDLFIYKSNNPNIPNQVYFEKNSVGLVKEIIAPEDKRSTEEITSKLGEAKYVLYGEDAGVGVYLYVYPEKGLAYLGHYQQTELFEIWYFQPTSFNNFKTKWAPEYSDTFKPIQ